MSFYYIPGPVIDAVARNTKQSGIKKKFHGAYILAESRCK